jgi:uroporphyrin-3 C-methyltransferase
VAASALALVALVGLVMLWQRLGLVQQELVRRATDVAEQAQRTQVLAESAQVAVETLQARLAVAEVRLSEVSLQRSQLEELMLSVSRSRDDTLVLDIESGLRLAMQQTELTGSAQPLLSALAAADQRIARAAQPRLNPVQRAIARDMDRIKASPVADLPALAGQLDELARLVDDMPLLNADPQPPGASAPGARPLATAPVTESVTGSAAAPNEPDGVLPPGITASVDAVDTPASTSPWSGLQTRWAQWSGQWWASVSQVVQDLVRVSRIQHPDAVLLAPDQSLYLRENLKIKLLNARLSLLSRQVPAARVDMQGVRAAIQKYFDATAPTTRKTLQTLSEALQATRTVDVPRPDESLAALAAAAKGR